MPVETADVSSRHENVDELIEAESTVLVGVKLGDDSLGSGNAGTLDEVVVEEADDFFSGNLSVLGSVKLVEETSLVGGELTHVSENLSESLDVTFLEGNRLEKVRDGLAQLKRRLLDGRLGVLVSGGRSRIRSKRRKIEAAHWSLVKWFYLCESVACVFEKLQDAKI